VKELALAALGILAFARGTFKHPPKKFFDFFPTPPSEERSVTYSVVA